MKEHQKLMMINLEPEDDRSPKLAYANVFVISIGINNIFL